MILDVGCGANPHGNVNIDAYPENREHCAKGWNPKEVENFVLADAHKLPFRNKTFNGVICFHALEHLENPLMALTEMNRVCNGIIEIRVPSQYSISRPKTHLFTWNMDTLSNLLKRIFPHVEVSYTNDIQVLGKTNTLRKWIPFINNLLSRLHIQPELYATCKTVT